MAQEAFDVVRERDDEGGRWVIRLADGLEAEMTYRAVSPGVIAINHTFTPPSYRGKGLADRLMKAAIADVTAEGLKVVPVCSYVLAQFQRHPDWAGLRAAG